LPLGIGFSFFMIVFELACEQQHRFEGWFASGEAFQTQSERGLLSCPTCSSARISKLPSSKIKRASEPSRELVPVKPAEIPGQQAPTPAAMPSAEQRAQLMAMVDHILQHTENVGPKFAEEARKIHQKESPERAIRGTATREETQALLEEGVPVLPLPVPPQSEWH
jgi:hypothetical protein